MEQILGVWDPGIVKGLLESRVTKGRSLAVRPNLEPTLGRIRNSRPHRRVTIT